MALLNIDNISKSFGDHRVIKDLSLSLEYKNVYSIVGANGAGKTTLQNLINGSIKPDKGNVIFNNENINDLPIYKRVNKGILSLWQHGRVFKQLSVLDNLAVVRKHPGEILINYLTKYREIKSFEQQNIKEAWRVLRVLELEDSAKKFAGDLSFGQQRLLAFGRVLMNENIEKGNNLIIADEPFSGINLKVIEKLKTIIREFASQNNAVLMIEHNLEQAYQCADIILLMHEGHIHKKYMPATIKYKELETQTLNVING